MDRREAIKQMALLTGGALSLTTVAGLMGGCTTTQGSNYRLQTLNEEQNQLVVELSERIIPATDTPGAKEAGVNEYIDHMLTSWNTEDEKDHFLEGLEHVESLSNTEYGAGFVALDQSDQVAIMEILQQEASNNPKPKPDSEVKPFFSMMKEFTIVGYYTSEVGASEELALDIVPGYYDGCVPYSELGKAWS